MSGDIQGRFAGSTVIVTGGASGLGAAIVEAFAREGASVVSADIACEDEDALPDTPIVRRHLDVSDEASWHALMAFVERRFGRLDVLVNNAGFYRPNVAFEDMPLDLWRRHFAINADGTFLGCREAIRAMKPRMSGAIVYMGSGLSITASPTGAAYCGSKAAVLMTTRTAARAAGAYGIRVNAVLPGAVPTDMLMGNVMEGESDTAFLDRMRAYSPLGKLAAPDDIARAVLFLADPTNAAISGIHLPVDGGNIPGA
ncbi:SDR family NAD(P)-dependent oxidoreductase [Novosphingobium sp. 9]|uniref:SDR family NAD(P)-dependent oxidoreductase n=1 Tax=Novosphingobium sp. 9 TaxID=2025349 RepID=UPI0021B6A8C9|nr:SDR family oxidoreductase [Novosphingobium sp. 9]